LSRRGRTYTYTARRGQFFDFVIYGRQPGEIDALDRIKSRYTRVLPPARRGQFQARIDPTIVVPPGSQALPPAWIIPTNRRRTFTLARRGRFAFAPFNGASLEQALPPQFISRRRQPGLLRPDRREFQPVVLVDQSVVSFRTGRRPLGARVLQRPRFQRVPIGIPDVPRRVIAPARRSTNLRIRRGSFRPVPPAVTTPAVNSGFFMFFG